MTKALIGDDAPIHLNQKYALEMRFESVTDLCDRFGLTFPAL